MATTVSGIELHKELVDSISKFLGPAGERFVNRQIKFHLKKSPDELKKADIFKIKEWIRVSLALLTDDERVVQECMKDLDRLSGN